MIRRRYREGSGETMSIALVISGEKELLEDYRVHFIGWSDRGRKNILLEATGTEYAIPLGMLVDDGERLIEGQIEYRKQEGLSMIRTGKIQIVVEAENGD